MKIILMHNPNAGDENHTGQKLTSMLEAEGHHVTYQSVKEKNYEEALKHPADLIVAAGGDGTIKRVALAAVDTVGNNTPIAVLSLGTANNLARALDVLMSPEEMIAELSHGQKKPFDVGLVTTSFGVYRFVEGCGCGLFPKFLKTIIDLEKQEQQVDIFALLREKAEKMKPLHYEITIDDLDVSGNYLLMEAMNIPSIGATLVFDPVSKLGDGSLEFVTATEDNRESILKSLQEPKENVRFNLPIRRFQNLKAKLPKALIHVDDKLHPKKAEAAEGDITMEINVMPGAIAFFVPPSKNPA